MSVSQIKLQVTAAKELRIWVVLSAEGTAAACSKALRRKAFSACTHPNALQIPQPTIRGARLGKSSERMDFISAMEECSGSDSHRFFSF